MRISTKDSCRDRDRLQVARELAAAGILQGLTLRQAASMAPAAEMPRHSERCFTRAARHKIEPYKLHASIQTD
jgi:hypothetical protein